MAVILFSVTWDSFTTMRHNTLGMLPYTCSFKHVKSSITPKIEYQNHLSMHNVESSNEMWRKTVKLEPAAGEKQDCIDQPHLLDQTDKSRLPEDLLFCAGSASSQIETTENLKGKTVTVILVIS